MPSYLFIVIVCAFMLAPLSTLPAADYFTSREWWAYIGANLTFLNFLQPSLPGVFDSPEFYNNAVNGSLWTMKVEWALYLSVPLVAYVTSKLKPRYLLPAFWTILATSILWRMAFTYLYESTGKEIYNILGRQFFGQLSYFYAGVILYYKRGWLLEHKIVSLALITAAILVTDIIPFGYIIISPLAVSAAVIYVSIVGDWGKRLSRHDNISYDMYLFHYPIIQVAVYFGMGRLPEIVLLAVIIAATVVLAYLERRFVRWLFYRQSNNT